MNKAFTILILLSAILMLSLVSANNCAISISLLNQDPTHAVPGGYVKVLFQIAGVDNPDCGKITFSLAPKYPFSLDPGVDNSIIITSGTYTTSYNSQATIPFTLRVDPTALDENYTLQTKYVLSGVPNNVVQKDFDILVRNTKVDFDVSVQDYDATTNMITLDILNTGSSDVTALTTEITNPQDLSVKGSLQNIIGSLDASQDTTFTYELAPQAADINLNIAYNDIDGNRRTTQKTVHFDPSYFTNRKKDQKTSSSSTYIVLLIVVIIIAIVIWRIIVKRRKKKQHHSD